MALFKILKGLKNNLPSTKKDGYCYFTTDDQMFYIDYLDNNNVLQRKPLNANDAITLLGKGVVESLTNDTDNLPTASAVYLETSKLQTAVDTKMDKNNPKGTGTFNFNTSGATGTNAVAFGGHAEGSNSFAFGNQSRATGDYSFAYGFNAKATGKFSYCEGRNNEASGPDSHAEGSQTQAIGVDSHAGGFKTIANKEASFAHGYEAQADAFSQAVFGMFNASNTTDIFQIGGGSSDTDRFNAFSITPLGAAKIKSSLNIGGVEDTTGRANLLYVSGNSYIEDGVRVGSNYYPTENKDLVTKDYVVNNLPQLTHVYVSATTEGQASFDFSDKISSLENFYLVYFNGLLLIEDVHYTVNGAVVNLLDWTARANDICHVVGLMPLNPDTNASSTGGV